jgi:alpha-beta hydrolase superfamily lysophospholipase
MGNQLDATRISHDPNVVQRYIADPLVHDRVTARLAKALVDGGAAVLAHAPQWRVPTLLLWAGSDRLVSPAGSAAFAAAAPTSVVTSRCFDGLYHEIMNELDAAPVFAAIDAWLDPRRGPA